MNVYELEEKINALESTTKLHKSEAIAISFDGFNQYQLDPDNIYVEGNRLVIRPYSGQEPVFNPPKPDETPPEPEDQVKEAAVA